MSGSMMSGSMMSGTILAAALIGTLAAPLSAGMTATAAPPIGLWQNPDGTIRVRTMPCGAALCGKVAAATQGALADARDAGVNPLIGVDLLRDYHAVGRHKWAGWVFVPDMGHSFSSRIVQVSPDTLRISGCLIGGMLCKSQIWTRV